ncbi:hypothetical protein PPK16_gp23 [Bacillus phage 049ML001]|uniref:Uncharacterized protein n=1 Tax=Bacillus phage 049ML001 TaxID=2601660 RepID=A0A5P8PHX8_9CAUD|nr:hypothetical protein PPK16_gp23 [Bacillus phage 049ML001]QFR56326.1 hypothetical protein 049ML001_23 [Bacillus phage 049ML001]
MKLEPEIINPEVKDKAPKPTVEEQLKAIKSTMNELHQKEYSSPSSPGSEGSAE